MKKISATILLLLLIAVSAQAQFDYKAQYIDNVIKPAKKIVLLEEDEEVISRGYAYIQKAMPKYWNATKVEFTTQKLSEARTGSDNNLYFGMVALNEMGGLYKKGRDMPHTMTYAVTFISRDKKGELQVDVQRPQVRISKNYDSLDVIWAVRILNNFTIATLKGIYPNDLRLSTGITPPLYRMSELNPGKLKTKVLLIDRERLNKKLDEAAIAEAYPYKFKVVSRAEIAAVVEAGDNEYAYFQSVVTVYNRGELLSTAVVLDAETGQMLSFSKITDVTVGFPSPFPNPFNLSKASLKEIVKNAD